MHLKNCEFSKSMISKYWNQSVMHFSGNEGISDALPNISELIRYLSGEFKNLEWKNPIEVQINASRINSDLSHNQLLSISSSTARNLYSDGYSLCFGDLSVVIDSIKNLKDFVTPIFEDNDLVKVTAYLSPPASIGVLHYDCQHNYFIQREGSKRWYVSNKPAVTNPYENLVYPQIDSEYLLSMRSHGYNIKLPNECGQSVFDLNPGDILYIPPGYYHSPETFSNPSLHFTLTVEPACFWKDLQKGLQLELMSHNEDFFKDYRFLTVDEKNILMKRCGTYIANFLQRF